MQDFLKKGQEKQYWKVDKEKKKITYFLKSEKSYKITDPEEIVRAEFIMELLEKYQYDAKDIEIEREMPQRVPNFYADIVVNKKGTDEAFLVIECKKADVTDSEFEQAVKQGAGNARVLSSEYFGTVAGESRRFFLTKNFSEKNPLEKAESDCPVKYNKPEEWRYKKGDKTWELNTIDQEGLKSILDKCHQTIWQGGKRNPGEAFSEVAKIIFVKVFDEKTLTKPGKFYQFQRKSGESSTNVKKRIDAIYDEAKKRDKEVFSEDIRLDAQEVTTVVEHLQKISLNKTDLDVKGEAFQKFMGNFFKGDFGQYFTPPPTVKFCLDLFKHELEDHHAVIDPSCGSGGFLLRALDTMREKADAIYPDHKEDLDQKMEHFRYWHDFAENKLFGVEISESIARVAKMNMILHDDGHTNVIANDALEPMEVLEKKNKGFQKDSFDYIFTNPPFGATIKGSEKSYLENYDLTRKKSTTGKMNQMKNQKTEILFIERCWQFLKIGGKMAVVLPDGILTNSSLQYVRDWILDHFKLLGVVSLPQDAFRYYGAGVKSSILILEKGSFTEDYPIFMAQPEKIGIDSTGRPCENDLDEVVKNFWEFYKDPQGFQKKKSENLEWVFVVWKKEIEGRFDFGFYDFKKNDPLKNLKCEKLENHIDLLETGFNSNQNDIKEGIPFLRTQNLRPINLELSNYSYTLDKKIRRTKKNSVLFTRIGAKVGTVSFCNTDSYCISDNIISAVFKKNIYAKYIAIFLSSNIGKHLLQQQKRDTARVLISYENIKNLKIPLPPLEIQKQIAEKMDNAFAEKKEKEAEAKEILDSIEAFLLGELGIEEVKEKKKEMVFCVSSGDIQKRFDTFFHQSEFQQVEQNLENGKFKTKKMEEVLEYYKKGVEVGSKKYSTKKEIPFVRVADISNVGIDFYKCDKYISKETFENLKENYPQDGEVLFSKDGTIGLSCLPDLKMPYLISGGILRLKPKNFLDKQFLCFVLSSSFFNKIQRKNSIGAVILHLDLESFKNLKIPIPPLEVQKKIAAEISNRREKAKQLQKEAKEVLEKAKREVERVILEG